MKITKSVNDTILFAFEEAKLNKDEFVTPEHLLYAALLQKEIIDCIENLGGNVEELKSKLKDYINEYISKV